MLDNFFTRRWPWLVASVPCCESEGESVYADALDWPHDVERPMDTPDLTRHWCPVCEPDVDPLVELLETWYCPIHRPSTKGEVDPFFPGDEWYQTEAGGVVNKKACDIIHRGRKTN